MDVRRIGISRPSAAGFTLTELLITIAIIALLASMLLPAIGKITALARTSRCASNLRMIVVASSNYSGDNEGYLPISEEGGSYDHWPTRISPFLDDTYRVGSAFKGNNVFHCPHAERDVKNPWLWWARFDVHFAMSKALSSTWMGSWSTPGWSPFPPVHQSRVRGAAVFYSEANSFPWGATVGFYDSANATTAPPWPLEGTTVNQPVSTTLTVRRILLHAGTVNRAFADGHIATLSGVWNVAVEGLNWQR